MNWDEFLNERPIGVIATIGAHGTPHAVPVEVLVRDERVYVWCERTSAKARNVVAGARAALTAYKSHAFVMVRGPARLLDARDPEYAAIARGFLDKYGREETYGNDALIEITPEHVASARI